MPHYDFHELANIFPMMEEEALAELTGDIRANGLRQPITLFEGKILDGRNRYRACEEASVEPRFETYEGADALEYVISLNLKRRHLDASQRAMIASRLANRKEGRPSKTPSKDGVSTAQAAKLLNVSTASVERAKAVHKSGSPELIAAVNDGTVKVSEAAQLAKPRYRNEVEGTEAVKDAYVRGEISKAGVKALNRMSREEAARVFNLPPEERKAAVKTFEEERKKRDREYKAKEEREKAEQEERRKEIIAEFNATHKDWLDWWIRQGSEKLLVAAEHLKQIAEELPSEPFNSNQSVEAIAKWYGGHFILDEIYSCEELAAILGEGLNSKQRATLAKKLKAEREKVKKEWE